MVPAWACVSKRPPLPEDIWQMVGSYLQRPTPSAAILESYFTKLGVFTATEMVRLASGRLTLVDGDCASDHKVRTPVCVRIVEWFQHAAGRANWAEVGGLERVTVHCPRTAECPTTMSGPWMSSPYKRGHACQDRQKIAAALSRLEMHFGARWGFASPQELFIYAWTPALSLDSGGSTA